MKSERRKAIEKANNQLLTHEWKKKIQEKTERTVSKNTDERNNESETHFSYSGTLIRTPGYHGEWIRIK